MPPFLEILTRTYQRPNLLAANKASLQRQTNQGWWRQTFLDDKEGRGVGWSYSNMAAYASNLEGLYVWILDDDDVCICDTLINDLEEIVASHNPDVIMLKMDHGPRGILPGKSWQQRPVLGDIGCSAFVVRREVWQAHAQYFTPDYNGDFAFISSIFDEDYEIYWHDCVASKVQRISDGQPERVRRVPHPERRVSNAR